MALRKWGQTDLEMAVVGVFFVCLQWPLNNRLFKKIPKILGPACCLQSTDRILPAFFSSQICYSTRAKGLQGQISSKFTDIFLCMACWWVVSSCITTLGKFTLKQVGAFFQGVRSKATNCSQGSDNSLCVKHLSAGNKLVPSILSKTAGAHPLDHSFSGCWKRLIWK